jgi:hypothetical protein
MPTLTARADVPTATPARYAKQLVSHLGRKILFTAADDGSSWEAAFGSATARVLIGDGVLILEAVAADESTLNQVEHVLGSHLERFAHRDPLTVTWRRSLA